MVLVGLIAAARTTCSGLQPPAQIAFISSRQVAELHQELDSASKAGGEHPALMDDISLQTLLESRRDREEHFWPMKVNERWKYQ